MLSYIRHRFHPLWRLRKFGWFRKLQKGLDFPVSIRNGRIPCHVMFLRDFALVVSSRGDEAATHSVFEQIIRELKISHLFDVGANIGSFSWHALNISPELEVHLFEPDETNVRLLKKTIRHNSFKRVHLWPGVVSNQDGPIAFLVDEVSGATGSIGISPPAVSLQTEYGLKRTVRVQSTTLDHYAAGIGLETARILVKIDVEGAEKQVVDGSVNFFLTRRPIAVVECFDRGNLDPLVAADYTVIGLPEDNNYVAVPNELVPIFRAANIMADRLAPAPV